MSHFKVMQTKGQFKCFDCRAMTRSKEGSWHTGGDGQVFLCKGCDLLRTPREAFSSSAFSFKRL